MPTNNAFQDIDIQQCAQDIAEAMQTCGISDVRHEAGLSPVGVNARFVQFDTGAPAANESDFSQQFNEAAMGVQHQPELAFEPVAPKAQTLEF